MDSAERLIFEIQQVASKRLNHELLLFDKVWLKIFYISPDKIKLESIISIEPLTGFGARAMRLLIDCADKLQVEINLEIEAFGHRALSNLQLANWYRKFGFVQNKGIKYLIRFPKTILAAKGG